MVCIVLGAAIGLTAAVGATTAPQPATQLGADSHEPPQSQQASHEYQKKSDSIAIFEDNISLTDARTKIYGAGKSDSLGETVAGVGNISGIEYDDVAIGAPHADNETGAVYLFFGPVAENDFNASAANVTLTGETNGDLAGMDVEAADLTDDGIQDLVVGAPRAGDETVSGGAVYIFHGEDIREHIEDGNTTVNLTEASETMYGADDGEEFGHSITAYSNATAMGEDDNANVTEAFLAVGAPGVDNETGAAYVFDGFEADSDHTDVNVSRTSANATQHYAGESVGDLAGWSVAAVDNYTDDGEPIVAIGAPGNNTGGENAGAVYVVTDLSANASLESANESLAAANLTLIGSSQGATAGWAVADANDVNGDDRHDLIVGAPQANYTGEKAGAAYVHFAASDRDGTVTLSEVDAILRGEPGDLAGWSVAGATNITCKCGGGGVLVGSPTADAGGENVGVVSLIGGDSLVTKAGTPATVIVRLADAQATLVGEAPGDWTGAATDAPGDVTGSDTGDILVGAPGYNSSEDSTYEKEGHTTTYNDRDITVNKDHNITANKSRGAAYIVEGERPDSKAFFDVEITDKNDPIEAGETLEVTTEVTNTGDRADTQDVRLKVGDKLFDTYEGLYLKPGEKKTFTLRWDTSRSDAGEYLVSVYSKDDRDKQKITVTEPPEKTDFFAVEITDKNDPIEAGETLEVTTVITNTGDETGKQDVTLKIGKKHVDVAKAVELGPGESETLTLRWKTGSADIGKHLVKVYTKDDYDKQRITVTEPPVEADFFDVDITEKNDPIEAGETLEVTTVITNTGDETGKQDIQLTIDGHEVDVFERLELASSESKQITLTWETGHADVGDFLVKVLSDDDYDKQRITVEKPPREEAFFDLEFIEKNDPIEAGETLTAEVAVTNTGNDADTQDIKMKVGDERVDVDSDVSLDPGQTETVTLQWETDRDDAGDHWVTVYSYDDRIKQQVTVEEPPEKAFFDVEITEKNDPIEAGETLEVTTEITNTGDENGRQDIRLTIDSNEVDIYADLELDPGESEQLTLTWEAGTDDVGKRMVAVYSKDDVDKQRITVEETRVEAAFFDVGITEKNDPINVSETLFVDARIENTGNASATQDITLTIDGEEVDVYADLELAPSENRTVGLEWGTDNATEPGTYTAAIASEDDEASQEFDVREIEVVPDEPEFRIDEVSKNDPVVAGETLTANVTVSNVGDGAGAGNVSLWIVDSGEVDTQRVELEPDENESLVLEWNTTGVESENYTVEIRTDDDTFSQEVTIREPPIEEPDFRIADVIKQETINTTGSFDVEAVIGNVGDAEGTEDVILEIDGEEVDRYEGLTLGPTANETVALQWNGSADPGEFEVTIRVGDAVHTQTLTVEEAPPEPAFFKLEFADMNDSVVAGEILEVMVSVTNTGGQEATQTIELFDFPEVPIDSEEVTLAPGESTEITLLWQTTEAESQTLGTIYVRSENDTISRGITVTAPSIVVINVDKRDTINTTEQLTVTVNIENWGDATGTETVSLAIDGQPVDSEELTLEADEAGTVNLTWEGSDEPGEFEITVLIGEISAHGQTVTVEESAIGEPAFQIDEVLKEEMINTTEPFDVGVAVSNVGDAEGTENVTLEIDDEEVDRYEGLTLGPTANETVALQWNGSADPGEFEVTIRVGDAVHTQTLTVQEPPEPAFFEVTELNKTNEGILDAGDTLNATATVENTGDIEATQNVTIEILDNETDETVIFETFEVTLASGQNESVTLLWETDANDADAYTVNVTTDQDFKEQAVSVQEVVDPMASELDFVGENDPVVEGEMV